MSNSKKDSISFKNEKGIIDASGQDPIVVTPTNPLEIRYTPAEFGTIAIQGGSIYVGNPAPEADAPGLKTKNMPTTFKVTIQNLTKTN